MTLSPIWQHTAPERRSVPRQPQYTVAELARLLRVSEAEISARIERTPKSDLPPHQPIPRASGRRDAAMRTIREPVAMYERNAFLSWWRAGDV